MVISLFESEPASNLNMGSFKDDLVRVGQRVLKGDLADPSSNKFIHCIWLADLTCYDPEKLIRH